MAKTRTPSEILDQNLESGQSIISYLWQQAGRQAEDLSMKKNIAYFLELENGEFNLDEAVAFYRDMKVEIAHHETLLKFLGKLDKKIKDFIKETGQMPQVDNVRTQVIPKRPTQKAEIVLLKSLCGDLRREGHEDIANRIMGCIVEVPNKPAVKFTFADLALK